MRTYKCSHTTITMPWHTCGSNTHISDFKFINVWSTINMLVCAHMHTHTHKHIHTHMHIIKCCHGNSKTSSYIPWITETEVWIMYNKVLQNKKKIANGGT